MIVLKAIVFLVLAKLKLTTPTPALPYPLLPEKFLIKKMNYQYSLEDDDLAKSAIQQAADIIQGIFLNMIAKRTIK